MLCVSRDAVFLRQKDGLWIPTAISSESCHFGAAKWYQINVLDASLSVPMYCVKKVCFPVRVHDHVL